MLAVVQPAVGPPPPRITHTAATPQDSPSTTLEPAGRAPALALYASSASIDSIDRSTLSVLA
ncbi:Protein of unknown function [Gryllus bimaculatus]|nr:Protein of unknown function [Gryllus bimaculatus]